MGIITKIFGTKHGRDIKKIMPLVEEINTLYSEYDSLSDDDLREKTVQFKAKIEEARQEFIASRAEEEEEDYLEELIELEQGILDEILPEAFACVKQACKRLMGKEWRVTDQKISWDMIPFDVQLIGGIVLHQGKIAEMATGEGKTLVASMPIYLNALTGRGVHLVTVNDYLARRDKEWMGKIYEFLGLTVGCILNDMDPEDRRKEYGCDITYGTNNEFGFDYLRDNMAISEEDQVQRRHAYAIVDEVDSVLIDEARTPLIISGPVAAAPQQYFELKPSVERLVNLQRNLVNRILKEAEEYYNEEKEYEAGLCLLRAQRGAPKNKKLMKMLNEPGAKTYMMKVENEFIRDKKMGEVDEELYYSIEEKNNILDLTEKGRAALSPDDPDTFVLPDMGTEIEVIENDESLSLEDKERKKEELQNTYNIRSDRIHTISQLLKAFSLFEKDQEYVIQDGKVNIVDEFTGRVLSGRRYSDGLHQAIEAKENVKIERETQTMATITLQNYFRLYDKLAGMTGTAETEANEFWEIYKLDVTVIPTNKPVVREDKEDVIYRTIREKYNAVIDDIIEVIERGRPVLVGTITVEVSETLSRMLKRRKVPHNVLNAKYHQKEAEIVQNAGDKGSVTIATNMAGRGTDIKLSDEVKSNGGLHIIGTERHEARRIDLQLRGRSGRQGDPGSSRFFLSLEDDLMRLFHSERIARVMDRLGAEDGDVIQHSLVSKSIERAQKKVEAQNFGIRKHLLEYDDVMNQQRTVVYDRRNYALKGKNMRKQTLEVMDEVIGNLVDTYTDPKEFGENWQWEDLERDLLRIMLIRLDLSNEQKAGMKQDDLIDLIAQKAREIYERKEKVFGEELMRHIERVATLRVIDEHWKEHLYEMDQIKEGVGLRAYAQKDPLIEYKSEGYRSFIEMITKINEDVINFIFRSQVTIEQPDERQAEPRLVLSHADSTGMGFTQDGSQQQQADAVKPGKKKPVKVEQKVGRNDPCPCGSGKKYKKCCGRNV